MQLIQYPHKKPLASATVVTVGNFDGVHLGHQHLINEVLSVGQQKGLQTVVVSMRPYPEHYFARDASFFRLTSVKAQFGLLKEAGIDCLCVLNFNQALAEMPAEDFFDVILRQGLQASHVIVGDDFRFGRNRLGDYRLLSELSEAYGMTVQQMSSFFMDDVRVSSSHIRDLLVNGDLAAVQRFLGRPYALEGRVLHGKKLGRTLGYPTLNIAVNDDVRLRGICVVSVILGGKKLTGVASVGHNPSVAKSLGLRYEQSAAVLEIHLFDFNRDVYGHRVQVLFHKKIRNEVKFDSLAALEAAMSEDEKTARLYFESEG